VVEHEARLNILSCLDASEPMSIAQVCNKAELHTTQVSHHLRILDSFGLVKGEGENGQALYVTRLKQNPAWVRRAVNRHRHRKAATK
jgi:predicted transcriptional regulator